MAYHHGDLREALIVSCLQLIESDGIGAVSLRKVAANAGVSASAPYHHFSDRAALLAAVSTRGFELLGSQLRDATAAADTPVHAIRALAEAYLGFANAEPAYFRLMFRPEMSQPEKHPDAQHAGEAAFAVLDDTIAECVAIGVLPKTNAHALAIGLWGVCHGLASLALDGQLAKRAAIWETTSQTLLNQVLGQLESLLETTADQ